MTDKRECVVARSVEIDWATNRWQLAPADGARIGAGLYICVPVTDDTKAAEAVARFYSARDEVEAASGLETGPAPYDTAANFARSCTVVPPGHFWRGVPESNRHQCRNCGEHYDKHLHTDEASLCPTANREVTR